MRLLDVLSKALAAGSAVLLLYGGVGLCSLDSTLGDAAAQGVQSSLVEGYSLALAVGVVLLLGSLQAAYRRRVKARKMSVDPGF